MTFDDAGWLGATEQAYVAWLYTDARAYLSALLATRYETLYDELALINAAMAAMSRTLTCYSQAERLHWARRAVAAVIEHDTLERLWQIVAEDGGPHGN
jgi:hypothetical protein